MFYVINIYDRIIKDTRIAAAYIHKEKFYPLRLNDTSSPRLIFWTILDYNIRTRTTSAEYINFIQLLHEEYTHEFLLDGLYVGGSNNGSWANIFNLIL